MTPLETENYIKFMMNTLPTLKKPTDTLEDELNLQIKYFKGVDILTYYTPSDPTKDKEPLLNYKLQKEWLPAKTVPQKQVMAKKKLLEGPEERAKRRKKEEKDQKIVRVVREKKQSNSTPATPAT